MSDAKCVVEPTWRENVPRLSHRLNHEAPPPPLAYSMIRKLQLGSVSAIYIGEHMNRMQQHMKED